MYSNGLRIFPLRNNIFPASGTFSASTWYFPLPIFFSLPGYFFLRKDFLASAQGLFLASEKIFRASKRNFCAPRGISYVSNIFPKHFFPLRGCIFFASARSVTKQLGEANHNKGNKASKQEKRRKAARKE